MDFEYNTLLVTMVSYFYPIS